MTAKDCPEIPVRNGGWVRKCLGWPQERGCLGARAWRELKAMRLWETLPLLTRARGGLVTDRN